MAGIADLLAMIQGTPAALAGAQGAMPSPDAQPSMPPQQGGVGAFLGGGDTDPGAQDQATPYAPPAPAPTPQAAPAAPAGPVTPPSDAGSGGLGGFLSRMVQKANAQNPDTGLSFIDKFQRFGDQLNGDSRGAEGITAAGHQRATSDKALAERMRLRAMADQLGMSPREKLLFQADPEAWAKANGERLGFHDLAGGHTAQYGEPGQPGSQTQAAPLVGQENGEGFSATPDKMTDLGSLAESNQQKAQEAVKRAQEAAMERYHELMAQAATTNAAANTTRAAKAGAGHGGGSSGLPPGY